MQFEHGNNLPRVKVTNQAAIRKLIYHQGPILRSEIAKKLSLTLPTITTNINNMILSGAIHEIDEVNPSHNRLGRKANPIDIVDDFHCFIGVEMRLRSRHLCITDLRGKILYSVSDNSTIPDYDQNIRQICTMISTAINSKAVPDDKISGIGVSVPGIVDSNAGKLLAHRQYGWYDKDIRTFIASQTGYKGTIIVDNDARARAIGAQLFRHQELNDASFFAYLFISHGISCPFIMNSSFDESKPLGPGELGYMVMDANKTVDEFGYSGSLNSLSGERSIMDRCADAIQAGQAPVLQKICEYMDKPTISQILQAQQSGEKSICDIIENAITYLGIAMANIYNFIQPDCIFVEARLFTNESNRSLFLETVYKYSIAQVTKLPKFIFIDYNELNGAQSAAAIAVRADLETYIE